MTQENSAPIQESRFPSGEIDWRIAPNTFDKGGSLIIPANQEEMLDKYLLIRELQERYPNLKLNLFMPYLPYSRMDRREAGSGHVFTLKYFAEFVNSLKLHHVYTFDAHSDVSSALFNHMTNISVMEKLLHKLPDLNFMGEHNLTPVAVFPNYTAFKRYAKFLPVIQNRYNLDSLEYVFGHKERDFGSGKIKSLTLYSNQQDDSQDSNKFFIIMDDICSAGGTFMYTKAELEQMYPTQGKHYYALCVPHLESTVMRGKLDFDFVVCTNSLFHQWELPEMQHYGWQKFNGDTDVFDGNYEDIAYQFTLQNLTSPLIKNLVVLDSTNLLMELVD